jgi:hypothetical protein
LCRKVQTPFQECDGEEVSSTVALVLPLTCTSPHASADLIGFHRARLPHLSPWAGRERGSDAGAGAQVPVVRSGLGMVDGFIYAYPNAQARTHETPGPARHCDFRGASPHGPRSLAAGGLSWRARQVWHVGMYRDPKTLVPVEYYNRFNLESTCDVAYVPPRPVLRWPALSPAPQH